MSSRPPRHVLVCIPLEGFFFFCLSENTGKHRYFGSKKKKLEEVGRVLGEYALRSVQEQEKVQRNQEEDYFANTFFSLGTDKVSESSEEEVFEVFFLHEDNEEVYGIFRTLILFLNDGWSIDPTLMVALIGETGLAMQETMLEIPSIHSEYYQLIKQINTPQEG